MELVKCLNFVTISISAKRNSAEVGLHYFCSELRSVNTEVSALYGQKVYLKIGVCQN